MREIKAAAIMVIVSVAVMALGIRIGGETKETAVARQKSETIYESVQKNSYGRYGIRYADIENITQAEMSIEDAEVIVRTCTGDKAIAEWEVNEEYSDKGISVELFDNDGILQIFTRYPKKREDSASSVGLKLRISFPRNIQDIYLKCDRASVVFADETDCNVWVSAGEAQIESRQHRGIFEAEIDSGSVKICSDRLKTSKIYLKNGNIKINAFLQTDGEHRYTAEMGNIELAIRNARDITPQLLGNITCEQGIEELFCEYGGARCLYACSEIGLITAKCD